MVWVTQLGSCHKNFINESFIAALLLAQKNKKNKKNKKQKTKNKKKNQ